MAYKTIKIKKYSDVVEEYVANAAIIPGMLIELMSTSKVKAHATSGGNAYPMFALEDELQGNGINDDYAAADRVQCWIPGRGDQVYAILADGESVAPGDFLESNGDGLLKKHVVDTDSSAEATTIYGNQIVGVCLDTIDISDSSGAESSGDQGYNKRVIVRIL
jgi:hypothetical protein